MMKLKERSALVTGANRGIGRAIALACAAEGADVAVGARSVDSLETVRKEIEAMGVTALPIRIDVSEPDSIVDAQNLVSETLGPVQILINNAGIAGSVKVLEMDEEHWRQHIDVNLTGTFRVTRAFLPEMVESGWGRVINIASTAGKIGYLYTAAYCASKHGVVGFTRALALEMATANVTVNAICPGFVRTDMARHAVANIASKTGKSEADAEKALEKMSPQRRMIEPEEIAAVAVMLASEEARGINGQAINIDGGAVVY